MQRRLLLTLPLGLALLLLAVSLLTTATGGQPAPEPAAGGYPRATPSPPPGSASLSRASARVSDLPTEIVPQLPLPPLPAPLAPPPPASVAPPAVSAPAPSAPAGSGPSLPAAASPDQLCAGYPVGRTIIMRLAAQELTACQDGSVFLDTLITTGRPELPTPPGYYSVLAKSSPWVMRSPWPRRSPHWYPPSRVRYVLWFREGGYGMHDAPWRDAYGPGTQEHGSHGCVNVPRPAMDRLFQWAEVGTLVLVG